MNNTDPQSKANAFSEKLKEMSDIAQQLSDGIHELRQAIGDAPRVEHLVVNTVTDIKGRVWNLCLDDVWRHVQKSGKIVEKPYYYYVGSKKGVHKFARWYPKTNMVFIPANPEAMPKGILDWPNPLNEQK